MLVAIGLILYVIGCLIMAPIGWAFVVGGIFVAVVGVAADW